jgi:hypothetical protein
MEQLVQEAKGAHEKCERTVRLAKIYQHAGELKQAEQTLVKARRTWPREAAPMRALYDLYLESDQSGQAAKLLDRATTEVRRGLGAGRFEPALFAMASNVAQLRGQHDAAVVAEATLAAIQGRPATIDGGGLLAGEPALDEHIAPEVFTPAFRSLLKATGWIMDAAVPFDLASLRAKPLTPNRADVLERTREIAGGYGIDEIHVFATNALGAVCVPARVAPPTLCFGLSLVSENDEMSRDFLIHRAIKVLQTHTAALSRTAPIDLWPLLAAYLKIHSPSFNPTGVDAAKLSAFLRAMSEIAPKKLNPQVNLLASEVIGTIGNRASSLNTAASAWGSRAALLALGDPNLAMEAIALAHGASSGPPSSGIERVRWIGRQPEARDLIVFSVSDGYAHARAQLGLEALESLELIEDADDG